MAAHDIIERFLAWVMVVVLAFTVAACGKAESQDAKGEAPRWDISVEEATSLLDLAVQYATAHDIERLCNLAHFGSEYQRDWWEICGGADAVPSESPRIVETYLIPTKDLGDYWSPGGRVLVLEGVDGLGRRYRTNFLVFESQDPDAGSGGLAVSSPFYWCGGDIGQTDEQGRPLAIPRE